MSNITTLPNNRSVGLAPQNLDEAMRFAELMSKSNIVPKDYQGNPGNVLVAIQWGSEVGLQPLQAMQNIAVINGRPALWGDAVIALVRGSGLLETIHEDITADLATCTVKRKGEPPASRSFSVEDAKRAGLYAKPGPWTQYPKRMLQMRARAWALRDVFSDVLRGISLAEEAQDMPQEKDITPAGETTTAKNRTSQVRAKLEQLQARPAPAPVIPNLDDVLVAINQSESLDALKQAGPMANALDEDGKAKAREAYKARKKEITERDHVTIDLATGEILESRP